MFLCKKLKTWANQEKCPSAEPAVKSCFNKDQEEKSKPNRTSGAGVSEQPPPLQLRPQEAL